MKKEYEMLEIRFNSIEVNDIITTSPSDVPSDDPFDGEEQPFISML